MPLNQVVIQDQSHKIVRFTNVSNFDFTPEMGAMFGGVPYFVPAGKSLLMPKPIGDHLAVHLARQILIRKAPIRDGSETDGKGSDRPLWDDQVIQQMIGKIVTDQYEEEKPAVVSEAERMASKVRDLNTVFPAWEIITAGVVTTPGVVMTTTVGDTTTGYQDKAEVIAELQKRNVKFDARKGKASLEELLK